MKFYVCAKILGNFLPAKPIKIGDCKIEKSHNSIDDERPQIPIRDKSSEFHILERGVRNYTVFPQKPISVRTFESDYMISTVVDEVNIYHALEKAEKRFMDVVAVLSLAIKQTTRKAGGKRFRRDGELYDFEILAMFMKSKGQSIRVRLPNPLTGGHNYFPEQFPKGFTAKAKKYLACQDPIFRKGLIYLERAYRMHNSGNFSEMEIILNLVKCIELISDSLGIGKIFDKKVKKRRDPTAKELFKLAGERLNVFQKNIKYAQQAWDARSKLDVAHKHSGYRILPFANHDKLSATANDYLVKYHKYISKK